MDFNMMSIITLLIGLVIGAGAVVAITILLGNRASQKAEKLLSAFKMPFRN